MKSYEKVFCVAMTCGALAIAGCCPEAKKETPPVATETPAPAAAPAPAPAPEPTVAKIEATPAAVEAAEQTLADNADRSRRMRAALSFEDFKATVYREPFEGGKYIVNGDTTIASDKELLEFYEKNVMPKQTTKLVLDQASGMDNKWNQTQKKNLKYCVSSTFGNRHADVVQQMANATQAWEDVAAVDFIYDASQDATCTAANAAVTFDVRPVNAGGEYLARAFFPNEGRAARNVLIDDSSFDLRPGEKLSLVGILRHELGHSIGFRHEHTRPESGTCFEDRDWLPLTGYDAFSVMHYPQCNGRGDWSLTLTPRDKNGAACVYGVAAGFTLDGTLVKDPDVCWVEAAAPVTPVAPGEPQTQSFAAQKVKKSEVRRYGPFRAAPGTIFEATMGGAGATGDPDLYVRYDKAPDVNAYDCRPFVDGPQEVCAQNVPSESKQVFVMVRGYSEAAYDLQVKFVPPGAP